MQNLYRISPGDGVAVLEKGNLFLVWLQNKSDEIYKVIKQTGKVLVKTLRMGLGRRLDIFDSTT